MADMDADIDLMELMKDSGLYPTQSRIYEGNVNEYAQQMLDDTWDWERTKTDLLHPMAKDPGGNITAGHHRFVAAAKAGVAIPDGVVRITSGPTHRIPRAWDSVTVREGYRPGRNT